MVLGAADAAAGCAALASARAGASECHSGRADGVQDVRSLIDQATDAAERLLAALPKDERRRSGTPRAREYAWRTRVCMSVRVPVGACVCARACACMPLPSPHARGEGAAWLQSPASIRQAGATASAHGAGADRSLTLHWPGFARAFAWSIVWHTLPSRLLMASTN